ncbi:DUF503 domain-containing protein [Peptococcaceae bacterium]|nr:DUF503 domain-containing protein [Peptococcaceae bacterium]MCL0071640.1 DUF503 domain-containing protein [Peptococcaceae bacterium]
MVVGTLTVELFIFGSRTLKDKRRILKSILDKVKSRFNVSIAEVDSHDMWQRSVLGIACVSNQVAHVQSVLSSVEKFISHQRDAEIISLHTEII